ncbi:UNVERIFIED_CONTAM: hypothetical protein Slati_2175600 [Sesamum latifolium]|uniref:Uncharacterized protein n=1 Tax=Sesamum latifolium TaxID=2727402 RepID=A0AAW2WR85_9LAMI
MALMSGIASTMSEKAIKKLSKQMALPHDYEYVVPGPFNRTNNPLPSFLMGYASQMAVFASLFLV